MNMAQSGFLNFAPELVVDLFAGGGGASHGLSRAYRAPDVAINHSPVAIAVHQANHPDTLHFTCDVFEVDPIKATGGRPVGVLWASPDCRHHSKAAGGKPRSKKVRALAWVVIKWAAACKPRVIMLENVEEFADWGPLLDDGSPCKARKGLTFRRWKKQLENLGYVVEHRELIAADYGAPTIRKRLYVVARCDGQPIVWPAPIHSKTGKGLPKWRPASDCIDFARPVKSIFDRKKPLAMNTQRRIAKGLWRYVLDCAEPFVVQNIAPFLTEHANASNQRVFSADEPMRTQCAQVKGGHFALVSAHLTAFGQNAIGSDLREPADTVLAGAPRYGLVSAFFEQANGGWYDGDGRNMREPVSTICVSGANQRVVSAYFVKYYGNEREGISLRDPTHTVTTKDRIGLVQVVQVAADILAPEFRERAKQCAAFLHEHLSERFPQAADMVLVGDLVLVDITLRMLAPRELARAQGFPEDYIIEQGWFVDAKAPAGEWRAVTKTDQVRLIGNSVCPDVAAALAAANLSELISFYARAA